MLVPAIQKIHKKMIPVCCIFCFLFTSMLITIVTYAGTSENSSESDFLLPEYKEQILFIDKEIHILESNLKFLQLKIDQMEIESRSVPEKMRNSIKFKENKIKALKSLRNRYQKLVPDTKKSSGTISTTSSSPNSLNSAETAQSVVPVNTGGEKNHMSIMDQVKKAGLSDWLEPAAQTDCTCLETRLPILFSSGSAKIPDGYKSFLKTLSLFIKDYDVRILIHGYADTDPIHTKQYPSNLELGASRAGAIARAIMSYGIKPSVFEVASTGEYRFASKKPVKWKNLQRHAIIRILFPNCRPS